MKEKIFCIEGNGGKWTIKDESGREIAGGLSDARIWEILGKESNAGIMKDIYPAGSSNTRAYIRLRVHAPDDWGHYNVQYWRSLDRGKTWIYAGIGRFCDTAEQVREYVQKTIREYRTSK